MLRLSLAAALALLTSCGSNSGIDPTSSSTSQGVLCGAEPIDHGDGTMTSVGCPFEQQTVNIRAHGEAVGRELLDASGAPLATIDWACGSYYMGEDAAHDTVIIDQRDGTVLSHGMLHAGRPVSSLPAQLATPLTLSGPTP